MKKHLLPASLYLTELLLEKGYEDFRSQPKRIDHVYDNLILLRRSWTR